MKDSEKYKRMEELFQLALDRHLDNCDFDIFEWLTSEERREFGRLQVELGEKEKEE